MPPLIFCYPPRTTKMSAAIQTLIENKETELANNKHMRDHYNEYYGYLMAEC